MLTEASSSTLLLAIALLSTGTISGLVAGLLGVGGGIIIVPILFTALESLGVPIRVSMHMAVGTSLATIIPTSISSVASHYRRDAFDWRLFKVWAPWMVIGCIAGTWLANGVLAGPSMAAIFGVVALIVATDLIIRKPDSAHLGAEASDQTQRLYKKDFIPVPTVIGGVSSIMGIGGGTLSVPILNSQRYPIHRAIGTSAGFGLVIAVPAAVGYIVGGWAVPDRPEASLGYINGYGFVFITLTSVIIAPLGARLAHALSAQTLRHLFAGFLILTAIRMFLAAFQWSN